MKQAFLGPSPPDLCVLDLNAKGQLLYPGGGVVAPEAIDGYLHRRARPPDGTSDIFLYVHGWRTSPAKAQTNGRALLGLLKSVYQTYQHLYSPMKDFRPFVVVVRWMSFSRVTRHGFRLTRDRAHLMSAEGRASDIVSRLLGYLDSSRNRSMASSGLVNKYGQYVHCLGHSFGGRFVCEAISRARRQTLGWSWASPHPFEVDSVLLFQMAAPIDVFERRFVGLLHQAPFNGPLVLTFSKFDTALTTWHRLAGDGRAVGAIGAFGEPDAVSEIRLRECGDRYSPGDFTTRIVNVDATWRFRKGFLTRVEGAHSSYLVRESVHLALSLAALSRRTP